MAILNASDISVQIDGKIILHDVTFEIREGAWVGLVGPNGSGKSTLLRALCGMLPYRGTFTLDGKEIKRWKPRPLARRVAFMQQSTSLVFDFTVEDLVLLGRSPHHGWLGDFDVEDRVIVKNALDRVDLIDLADRSVLTLSGGELQRAMLAQALVQETSILLLDEPTSHLDVHHQFEFMRLVGELVEAGKTIVTVFHDLELAARHASDLLVLHEGALAAYGRPETVLDPELLRDVFRMNADIDFAVNPPRINYHGPVDRSVIASPTQT